MGSPDPMLNIRLRMLDGKYKELKEFDNLDLLFDSGEISEEVKLNIDRLKIKFNQIRISFASHILISKEDAKKKQQEITDLTDDLQTANNRIEQSQSTITRLQMKTSVRNALLWDDFESTKEAYKKAVEELNFQSALLQDYNTFSSNLTSRNKYLENQREKIINELNRINRVALRRKEESGLEIETLKKKLKNQDERISRLFLKYSQREAELLHKISDLSIERSNLPDDQLENVSTSDVRQTIGELDPSSSTDRPTWKEQSEQIATLLTERDELKSQLAKIQLRTSELETLNLIKGADIHSKSLLIEDLYTDIHKTNMTCLKQLRDIRYLKHKLKKSWRKEATIREQSAYEINNARNMNAECNKKITEIEQTNKNLILEKNNVEQQLQSITEELQSSTSIYVLKIDGLEREKKALTEKSLSLETQLKTMDEKLQVEKNAHLQSLGSLEEDTKLFMYTLTVDNNELGSKNDILSSKLKTQEEQIARDKSTLRKFKKQLKTSVTRALEQLEQVKHTFGSRSPGREADEPSLANLLSDIKTNLVNMFSESGEPTTTQVTSESSAQVEIQNKEKELSLLKLKVTSFENKYNDVSQELQMLKTKCQCGASSSTQSKKPVSPREKRNTNCTRCSNLTKRIRDLEAKIESAKTDETIQIYKSRCARYIERVDHLEKELQRMNLSIRSENKALETKYNKLKTVAQMRFNEIKNLKARLGADSDQGHSSKS